MCLSSDRRIVNFYDARALVVVVGVTVEDGLLCSLVTGGHQNHTKVQSLLMVQGLC